MYAANDTAVFNPKGLLIYDPLLTDDPVQESLVAVPFVESLLKVFAFNATFLASIRERHVSCGFADFLAENLQFPPPGPLPALVVPPGCDLWTAVFEAVLANNPCFNVYQVTQICTELWDVLGYPGSFAYVPEGATVYFNRTDVQDAIHAPNVAWDLCNDGVFGANGGKDASPPSSYEVLPRVIDLNERTVIAHGALDYVLIAEGTLVAIQNMTWGGLQGFQEAPDAQFLVPNGRGVAGKTRTERKLTYVEVDLAGHMVPQYAPAAAYRQLEFLLGRVPSLEAL